MRSKTNTFFISLIFLCAFSACANRLPPSQRLISADHYANQQGWKQITIKSEPFDLVSFLPGKITKQPFILKGMALHG